MGAMLLLVLGNNYLVMFVGWEGVGLCSYLLIGFYYDQEFPPHAGKKAFIVNRIGDFAFLRRAVRAVRAVRHAATTATMLRRRSPPTRARRRSPTLLGLSFAGFVALCLFVGAMGKSAQIPLYVWLPDAMAGPTPVSALIHAATMVTAGVYMVVRSNVLLPARARGLALRGGDRRGDGALRGDHRPGADRHQEGARLLDRLAARLHVPGRRRRRLLGGGLPPRHARLLQGAALPRLGLGDPRHERRAGHARRWAACKKHLPITYRTFLIGTHRHRRHPAARRLLLQGRDPAPAPSTTATTCSWAVGLLTAGLTAFYMFRAVYLTFHGKFRGTHEQEHHLHESPPVMTVPLMVLASARSSPAGSASAGRPRRGPQLVPPLPGAGDRRARPASTRPSIGARLQLEWALILALGAGRRRRHPGRRARSVGRRRGLAGRRGVRRRRFPRVHRPAGEQVLRRRALRPARSSGRSPRCRASSGRWSTSWSSTARSTSAPSSTELTGDLGRLTTTGNVRNYALYFFAGAGRCCSGWMIL